MSIKRTIITTIVALALVAVVAPAAASAALTSSQVQAIISLLQSFGADATTIANVQSSLTGGTPATGGTPVPTGSVACAGVSFTRNLTVGSTGSDVKCLQVLLNANGYTLAATGAGSPGMETSYFGPITLVAVKAFQTAHGWTPANQVGPLTRAALNAAIGGTGGNPPIITPTGSISASLASDNPASGAVVSGQATADMLHINFMGTGIVTSVTLQRSGISDQNSLTNVYLFDGATRLTDGYSFNASGQIVMNGLNITVNGYKTISVKADVAALAYQSASTIAVALTGYTGNGSSLSANVMGNTQSIVVGNLAQAILATGSMTATATINAGTTQYTFWTDTLQINTRSVLLKTANFRMIGSAPADALANIKLFIDGVDTGKVATIIAINGSNYAMFDLTSAPITLTTGSHSIDVRANVEKGTNRTVQLSVQQASDLTVFDPQVGVNIAVVGPLSTSTSLPANSGTTVTIGWGTATVTVDPTFTSVTNISAGATNAVIGRFVVHAYGEDVKIQNLDVTPSILGATAGACSTDATTGVSSGTCGINNVTLYFNGSQVGSQVNYSAANGYTMGTDATGGGTTIAYTLGSQVIAPAGQDSILEIRADLQTSGGVAYTVGTVKVGLLLQTANAYGTSSQYTVGVPTADVSTTGLTIQSATLVVSKSSAVGDQSIAPNTPSVRIGSYIVQNQSTSEAVRLTTLTVKLTSDGTNDLTNTAGTGPALTDLSALRTSDTTGSGSNPIQPTATNTFSVSDILQPGASMTIDIFAQTGSATSGDIVTRLTVASIGASSNIADAGTIATGQTMSLGTGTLATPTIIVSSTTPAQYIAAKGGAANASQATFNFVSTSGDSKITELKFTVSDGDADPAQTVTNICVDSVCASPVAGVADLNFPSGLIVPNGGGGLTKNVQVSYAPVGTGGVIPGDTTYIYMTYVKSTSGATTTASTVSVVAPTITLVGSKPTVVVASGGATGMVLNTSTKVGQATITADTKGSIKLRQLNFALGYSGFGTSPTSIDSAKLTLGGQTTAITGSTCTVTGTTTNVVCKFETDTTAFDYADDLTILAGESQQFDLYITTGGAVASATLKGTISSALYSGAADTSATASTTSSFLWDDTSTNGWTATGLTNTLIYGFPSNSYSVSQ